MITLVLAALMASFNILLPVSYSSGDKHFSKETSGDNSVEAIVTLILEQQPRSETEFIDMVRNFVRENSFIIEGQPDENAFNTSIVLQRLLAHYFSPNSQLPRLNCLPQSLAMAEILAHAGIESRLVELTLKRSFAKHVVLEVFNPETQQWEVQDALANVYYLKSDGQLASAVELVAINSLENITPVSLNGSYGWKETDLTWIKDKSPFVLLAYDFYDDNSPTKVLYNPETISLNDWLPYQSDYPGITVQDHLSQFYSQPIIDSVFNHLPAFDDEI